MAGFGEQGMAQSRDFAFHVCTICSARVRMSYFVPMFFGYECLQLFQYADRLKWAELAWQVLAMTGVEVLLLATVLCHEFGHGNMARYLGGEIDHVLLWVFGGICFSSRARYDGVNSRKLLQDDLAVVAAGPATHIFQAPFWGLILWVMFTLFTISKPAMYTGYANAWQAFVAALNPLTPLNYSYVKEYIGLWQSLGWYLVGNAITLNVALFLFNVFFPMYPADGSKLLVTSLMFCCRVTPRRACNVLLALSVPCASAMIVYSAYKVLGGFRAGLGGGSSALQGMMGFMGLMSLMESWKIYNLRNQRRLHTHSLFQVARSWSRQDRDAFGVVHRVNVSDLDDEIPVGTGGCGSCIAAVCPCFAPNRVWVGQGESTASSAISMQPAAGRTSSPSPAASPEQVRAQRNRLLGQVEEQQSHTQKSVEQLDKERRQQEQLEKETA